MEQGTNEWREARQGRITASRFGCVLAKPSTKKHQNYLKEVALNVAGVPSFDDCVENPPWFQHGIDNETEARNMFEWETGLEVKQVGIIIHPEHSFISCSPDGLTNNPGLEIKCRSSLSAFLNAKKNLNGDYKAQIQGCMWISGLKSWFYVNYFKKRLYINGEWKLKTDIHIREVDRDDKYIKTLEKKCLSFWDKVQELATEIT